MKLSRLAKSLAAGVNVKRRAKGLLPRPVGYSDVMETMIKRSNLCLNNFV